MNLFIIIMIIGTFIEAYLLGSISAQIMKYNNKIRKLQRKKSFVDYSIEIHQLPDNVKTKIMQFFSQS